MKNVILFTGLIVLFAASAFAQAPCTRHVETAGKFSYCPPAGWIAKDPSNGTYKIYATLPGATPLANLNLKDEVTSISNSEYMAAALKLMLADNPAKGAEATKLIGWTDFATTSNVRGSRLVYETHYKGNQLRTIQYVFDAPGRKLILTGTALEGSKDITDKIFDTVAKTFRLNP